MKKSYTLLDIAFQEEYLSIFAIGLLECMKKDLIDSGRAESWLFSPVVAFSAKEDDFSKQFIAAMDYASELDACRGSEYYQSSIFTAQQQFCEVLKNAVEDSANIDSRKTLIDYHI